jgi:hypothetical protein
MAGWTIALDENPIRPLVIGRKGWMFSGSPHGAHASATLYSLIETAEANSLKPRAYLTYLFERLPEARTPAVTDTVSRRIAAEIRARDLAYHASPNGRDPKIVGFTLNDRIVTLRLRLAST